MPTSTRAQINNAAAATHITPPEASGPRDGLHHPTATRTYKYGVNPVLYYIPNLIGYTRVVMTFCSFITCWRHPMFTMFLYAVSQLMDALDGTAARYYQQVSRFGAVLDMLTDRMSTGVLFIVLSHQYPQWWGLFAFLLVLDLVSHWFQMYSKMLTGNTSHKGGRNALLHFYYTFPYALLLHCLGNEGFFISLYILAFPASALPSFITPLFQLLNLICFPIACMKQLMNVIQLWDSTRDIVELDFDANMNKQNVR